MAGKVIAGVTRNPRKLFSMTDSARNRLRHLLAQRKDGTIGIRIGVKRGGCNGFVYTMDYADKINKNDEVVKDGDITLIVDPKATLAIVGTEMDFKEDKLSSGFVFVNPNVANTCECSESFTLKPEVIEAVQKQKTSSTVNRETTMTKDNVENK